MSDDLPMNDSIDGAASQAGNTEPNTAVSEQEWEQPQISAGEQLRTLREAHGWSAAQVANQLNLATRQIEALEQDNYAALPGMVIVRGFVRSYAKLMQADAAPILAAINGGTVEVNVLPPARTEMSASFTETQLLSGHPRRGIFFKLVSALVILLILVLTAFYVAQRMHLLPQKLAFSPAKMESGLTSVILEKPEDTAKSAQVATQTKPASDVVKDAANDVAQDTAKLSATDKAAASTKSAEKPVATTAASVAPATNATSAASTNSHNADAAASDTNTNTNAATATAAAAKNPLVISASEDSWLEIKQADDTVIVSRILQAGSSEVVDINKPVSIVIGNAAGVKVTFRGKPVDVTSGNSSNVARLNLK